MRLVHPPKRDRRISSSIRREVIARDLTSKGLKWDPAKHHIDHVVPFSRGGDHSTRNLRVIEKQEPAERQQDAGRRRFSWLPTNTWEGRCLDEYCTGASMVAFIGIAGVSEFSFATNPNLKSAIPVLPKGQVREVVTKCFIQRDKIFFRELTL